MSYEIKDLIDGAEREEIWKKIDAAEGFEKVYFSLNRDIFFSMSCYISRNLKNGNWLINFSEPYDSWNYFLFSFAGVVYLMKAEVSDKFFVLSHVPNQLRENFVFELREAFGGRTFYGPPVREGGRAVCIEKEMIVFSWLGGRVMGKEYEDSVKEVKPR